MSARLAGPSANLVRGWTACYTAGLPRAARERRIAEIECDTAEHFRARVDEGWSRPRIVVERLLRLLRGLPADLGWRNEVLVPTYRSNTIVRGATLVATSVASLAVVAFHFAFAAYLLGSRSLSDRSLLHGLNNYVEEVDRPVASVVAATVITVLGILLLVATVTRISSPMIANLVTMGVVLWSVLWFWLGVWPVALVALAGSAVDMSLRTPNFASRVQPGAERSA